MKYGYRVILKGSAFECAGYLERVSETYLLRLLMRPSEFLAVQRQLAGAEPVEVLSVAIDGQPVLAAHIRLAKGRPDGPIYDVACLLVGPGQ